MTINEAIKTQEEHLDGNPSLKDDKLRRAMHLGIEALKRERFVRQHLKPSSIELLRGETTE